MPIELKTNRRTSKLEWLVLIVLVSAAVLSFFAVQTSAQSDGLAHIYFLDVGQGDSEFIQAPNGNQVLIDGGPDNKVIQELGRIMPFYDHSIDLVVLTHPHADHVNGLIEVLKRYHVGQIIENSVPYGTAEYAEWNRIKPEAPVLEARTGQIVDLGDGIKLTVLYPYQPGANGQEVKNVHDFMVVSRLDYGDEGVLFMGDAEAVIEHRLVLDKANLAARFLKVGHHGSKTSTTEEFLRTVSPSFAFIEVGAKNRYGHPHPSTIQKLLSHDIKYYRTDIDGTKELILDGQSYVIH